MPASSHYSCPAASWQNYTFIDMRTAIKRQQTSCTAILMLQSQILFHDNFSPLLARKAEQFGSLSEVLTAQKYILLDLTLSPKTNLCPLHTFHKIQPNSCHLALLIRSDPKILNL
jgi:hypothetical protein